jgi:hypothetical protein
MAFWELNVLYICDGLMGESVGLTRFNQGSFLEGIAYLLEPDVRLS